MCLLAGAAGIALALAAVWYAPRLGGMIGERLWINRQALAVDPQRVVWTTFPRLFFFGAGPFLSVLSLAGLLAARKNLFYWPLAAAVLVPYPLLPLLSPLETTRYVLPFLPWCAVLGAMTLRRLPRTAFRIAAPLVLLTAAAQLAWLVATQPSGPLTFHQQHERFQLTGSLRPQTIDRGYESIAEAVLARHRGGTVEVLMDSPPSEAMQARLFESDPRFAVRSLLTEALRPDRDPARAEAALRAAEMIVLGVDAKGDPLPVMFVPSLPEDYVRKIAALLEKVRIDFREEARAPVGEGITLLLLVRRSPLNGNADP